jgi:tryptophan halogenase
LQAKINLYQSNGRIYRQDNELFNETSWLAVMHGQGINPRGYHPLVDTLDEPEILRRLNHIQTVIDKSAATMPLQQDFIAQHCQAQL